MGVHCVTDDGTVYEVETDKPCNVVRSHCFCGKRIMTVVVKAADEEKEKEKAFNLFAVAEHIGG